MIDLYYWPTPNGRKITIMLEECGLDYAIHRVDIGAGDQFEPEFLRHSPNNRMPALFDRETDISLFEGGAILIYLAEKTGRFMPSDDAGRFEVIKWLFWQAAGLGPMAGQLSHFINYAKEDLVYAKERYANEYDRLLAVLDVRLRDRDFIAGDVSIADFACLPWVMSHPRYGVNLDKFVNVREWYDTLLARPAVQRGVEVGADWKTQPPKADKTQLVMFGQNAETVYKAAAQWEDAE
ncbi:MAG: glutathione binding-like protein [Pseudomonadota bacterium]